MCDSSGPRSGGPLGGDGLTSEGKNVYDVYRDYLKHEDTLIHYRSSWFGVIQSFLITGYVFALQRKTELGIKLCNVDPSDAKVDLAVLKQVVYHVEGFLILMGAVGLALSVVAYRSISAAAMAVDALSSHYSQYSLRRHAFLRELPFVMGGGSPGAMVKGASLSNSFPIVMGVFWLCLILFSIYTSFLQLDLMH